LTEKGRYRVPEIMTAIMEIDLTLHEALDEPGPLLMVPH
jgi:hypothetical protein